MSDGEQPEGPEDDRAAHAMIEIGAQERRLMRERSRGEGSVWFGLGMMGMVGWSVILPALVGVLVGAWLDGRLRAGPPWTLVLLFVGVGLGSLNAWRWVSEEQANIERESGARGRRELPGDGDDE